jgi:hypothetical protein
MKNFSQALCVHFGCGQRNYLRLALTHSVYPRARPLVWLFLIFGSRQNLSILEAAAEVESQEELHELLHEYSYHVGLNRSSLLNRWKLRVSGQRLQQLFTEVMREKSHASAREFTPLVQISDAAPAPARA